MQITVTVPDEFAAQAEARGLTPEGYIEQRIAGQAPLSEACAGGQEMSADEFEASLDALAQYSEKIPIVPIESFSRESFYQDRD